MHPVLPGCYIVGMTLGDPIKTSFEFWKGGGSRPWKFILGRLLSKLRICIIPGTVLGGQTKIFEELGGQIDLEPSLGRDSSHQNNKTKLYRERQV